MDSAPPRFNPSQAQTLGKNLKKKDWDAYHRTKKAVSGNMSWPGMWITLLLTILPSIRFIKHLLCGTLKIPRGKYGFQSLESSEGIPAILSSSPKEIMLADLQGHSPAFFPRWPLWLGLWRCCVRDLPPQQCSLASGETSECFWWCKLNPWDTFPSAYLLWSEIFYVNHHVEL